MGNAAVVANEIERTISGPMWHGPALAELLDGVAHDRAAARPIAGAHTIWEIVLHVTAWADIARERLAHRSLGSQPPEVDWPATPSPSAPAWEEARSRLAESHRLLAHAAGELSPEALNAMVPVD